MSVYEWVGGLVGVWIAESEHITVFWGKFAASQIMWSSYSLCFFSDPNLTWHW